MSSFLKLEELKEIDPKIRSVVFGFIREAQEIFPVNENPYYIVPELITYMILNFYYARVFWDIIAEQYALSENKQTITKTMRHGWSNASYINIEVDSMEECIARWYVTTDKCGTSHNDNYHVKVAIMGGAYSTKGLDTNRSDGGEKEDFVYWSYNGHLLSSISNMGRANYSPKWKEKDVICCILDLKNKEISFELNGENVGIACKYIKCQDGWKYRCGDPHFILNQNAPLFDLKKSIDLVFVLDQLQRSHLHAKYWCFVKLSDWIHTRIYTVPQQHWDFLLGRGLYRQ